MEDDDGESVGGGSSAVGSASVAIDASTSICASEESIEVSTTYVDVSAVSLYRGTFNIDDASSAASSAASAASASTITSVHNNRDQSLTAPPLISIKEVTTPAPAKASPGGNKSAADQKKPSPTSVDMFDLFLAESAEVQQE